jgi:hypothetical protein
MVDFILGFEEISGSETTAILSIQVPSGTAIKGTMEGLLLN